MVMESCRPCDIAEILSFAEINTKLSFIQQRIFEAVHLCLPCESVVNAERQADHLLSDDHQRSCYVDGVRSIILVLTVQVDAGEITQRNHHHNPRTRNLLVNRL